VCNYGYYAKYFGNLCIGGDNAEVDEHREELSIWHRVQPVAHC
jgi:hypothetical protein